jgi:hypothetical protein
MVIEEDGMQESMQQGRRFTVVEAVGWVVVK